MKNNEWRNDPITEKQKMKLRMADEWFTFERLDKMSKGEASDYIDMYFGDDGKVIPEMFNKKGFENSIDMSKFVLRSDVGRWLRGLSEKFE